MIDVGETNILKYFVNRFLKFTIKKEFKKMTEKDILIWLKRNLGDIVGLALDEMKSSYSVNLLLAIARREVGFLIPKYVKKKLTFKEICEKMRGDYSQRRGEHQRQYHGFGFWQIDIDSYPDFVKSGLWKDPLATCKQAIKVLNEKKRELKNYLKDYTMEMVIASYNCGSSRVYNAVKNGKDVDYYTYNKDYSKEVMRFKKELDNL